MPLTAFCLICDKLIITNDEVFVGYRGLYCDQGRAEIYNNNDDEKAPQEFYIHEACARSKESK